MLAAMVGRFLVILATLVVADDCQADAGTCSTHLLQAHADRRAAARHFWPTFRGQRQTFAAGEGIGSPPADLSKPAWTWQHPKGQYHTLVSGGPVIDKESNLYMKTGQDIRKWSPMGAELWIYKTPGFSNNEPSLYGNLLLSSTTTGVAFAVDRVAGKVAWTTQLADSSSTDCGYPAAHKDVFVVGAVFGADPRIAGGGNQKVFGLDVNTGHKLWEYAPDNVVWNFSPLFPDDQSVVFMDFRGGMYKLALSTGQELWNTPPKQSETSFTDGGPTLGQNGKVYSCSNYGGGIGMAGDLGVARAFDLTSGDVVWEKMLSQPCVSFPAVGSIRGFQGKAVVLPTGAFSGAPNLQASVLAINAENGQEIWTFNTDAYTGTSNAAVGDPLTFSAAGELEGRSARLMEGLPPQCGPAHWSAPTIDSKGTVYVMRMSGQLFAVHGPKEALDQKELNPALVVDPNTGVAAEVRRLGSASLHGAQAWAPGMYATSTCDTLYVYQTA